MTLSFSSFSIKDILTRRDGKTGFRSLEELCTGDRGDDLTHQDAEEDRIHPHRLSPELRLSVGNLRSESCREEETDHGEGETFTFILQKGSCKIQVHDPVFALHKIQYHNFNTERSCLSALVKFGFNSHENNNMMTPVDVSEGLNARFSL